MSGFKYGVGRVAEFLVGGVFVAAAILKAYDANSFAGQIAAYQVLTDKDLLGPVALVVLFFELFLGLAMVFGLRLGGLIFLLVQAMLLVFSGLIVYAWQAHGLEDCGCFGAVKMTPTQSLLKNAVLFVMVLVAWALTRRPGDRPASAPIATLKFFVALIVAGVVTTYAAAELGIAVQKELPVAPGVTPPPPSADGTSPDTAPAPPAAAAGPFAAFTVQTEAGETLNLGQGEYLVALLSMTCDHCKSTVPQLNDFTLMPNLPPLVGLCYEPAPGDFDKFRAETGAQFPMHNLGNSFLDFSRLIGNAPPRLSYIVDGTALVSWDPVDESPFPEPAAIEAAIEEKRAGLEKQP